MTNIEHREIKGITMKNITVTIFSMISIVISVVGTYFQLKSDIRDLSIRHEAQARINEIRLKVLESEISILQEEVNKIKTSNSYYSKN